MSEIQIRKTGDVAVGATSDGKLSISVPIQIKRRSGRMLVTLPSGKVAVPRPWDVAATPLQMALARGHRWLTMLESGEVKSLRGIAELEKLDERYIRRMVKLTSLAPDDIVAAILDDDLPSGVTLFDFSDDVPLLWEGQRGRMKEVTQ